MARRLVLRPKADRDLDGAIRWYESQRPGLGQEFLTDVREAFLRISGSPDQYALILPATRRALLDRFPYAVFFRTRPSVIDVVAVLHTSRNPRIWRLGEPVAAYGISARQAA